MNFRPVAARARTRIATCFVLAALSIGVLAACDENKGGGTTTTTTASTSAATTASTSASTTATDVASASATASTTATAEPTPSGSGSAVASASATTKPTGTVAANTATASATTTASAAPSDSAGAVACGGKDQPKCPLQAWMATVMQPAMASKDPAKLAAALRASAKFAPPGYGDWAKYSNDGAAAVDASKSVDDGKPSCKSCHGAYQKRYRTEMRDRKI
jgi:hypothetical protein